MTIPIQRLAMETVLENIAAGVISVDHHGRVATMNKAAAVILELSAVHCLGRSYRQVFDAAYLQPLLALLRTMQINHTDNRQEQMHITVRGRTLILFVRVAFLRDCRGNAQGIVVVFDDLTALIKAQKAAAWREVARGLVHEIKNPLTPIQLSAQRLQKQFSAGTADWALVEECTTTIMQQVAGLKDLVNEFSQLARMPEAHPAVHDLSKLIDEVIALYSGIRSDLRLTATYDPCALFLKVDGEQIKRVCINLLKNAVEAMQGTGDIYIVTRLCPSRHVVQIEIRDTGPGVPAQYRDKIFEPYFSTKKRGTGLGLSLAHRIITNHGGGITLAASRPASGATFLIELPVT